MTKKGRTNPCAVVIESRGHALGNFYDLEPLEFKVKSKRERKREQEIAWKDFDLELAVLIKKGKFGVDPETGMVKRNDKNLL